jgi:hypothetical protein
MADQPATPPCVRKLRQHGSNVTLSGPNQDIQSKTWLYTAKHLWGPLHLQTSGTKHPVENAAQHSPTFSVTTIPADQVHNKLGAKGY